MAVVEKKPEATTARPIKLGLAGLAGVVYVLGSIAVAFKAIPALFGLAGLGADSVAAGLCSILALLLLAVLGYRLLGGKESRLGLRAAVFLGFMIVLVGTLLGRWVGGLVEGWTYDKYWFEGNEVLWGGGIALVVTTLVALLLLRWHLGAKSDGRFERLESAGWFSANTYKPGQGTRVRRGTILGVLLLCGSGIWVLLNRGVLERGSSDWELNVPFTGKMAVDELGDAPARANAGPLSQGQVRILSAGAAKDDLKENVNVDRDDAMKVIEPLADAKETALVKLIRSLRDSEKKLDARSREVLGPARVTLEEERDRIHSWVESLEGFRQVLKARDERLFLVQRDIERWAQAEQDREAERLRSDQAAKKRGSLEKEMKTITEWVKEDRLPVAATIFSRFVARDINDDLDPRFYRLVADEEVFASLSESLRFSRGDFVRRDQFEKAVVALQDRAKPRRDGFANDTQYEAALREWERETAPRIKDMAQKAAPDARPMKGTTYYASLTLLPAVKYTVPLLLLGLAIWFAWRLVNVPRFADFLIATESELNKVSWTTRQRLIQDTAVVLVTMVLVAAFLFVVDITWAKLLSSDVIRVIKVSKDKGPQKPKDPKW